MSRIHRLTTAAGTALAVAALAAGSASAQSQDLRSPDTRDAAEGRYPAVVHQDLTSPDARDAAERRTPVIVRVGRSADTGMSWDSAAIGALAAAGLLISLAGAGALVSRRRVRPVV
jgi:hypothetical protein